MHRPQGSSVARRLNFYEAEELASLLKQCVDVEREIEGYRAQLSMRYDFNLHDMFQIFDVERHGYILAEDYMFGMR
jgi:hypothetical protein